MSAADWSLFLGRFHPLLVHLPIGLVIALVFLELVATFRPRRAVVRAAAGPLLVLLVPTTLAAALCGWLLAAPGGYDAALLQKHRFTGLAVAVLTCLMALAHSLRRSGLYRFFLVACCAVLVPASHYGGSLTHGRDYLTRYAPAWWKAWLGPRPSAAADVGPASTDPAAFDIYLHGIQPVFDRYCVSCHGSEKARGGLRLDHAAGLWIGGDSGPAIAPGQPDASLLLQRMRLPLDHDDHMPPEGKPQPEPADLDLLAWWIGAGAPTNRTLAELTPPEPIRQRLLRTSVSTSREAAPGTPGQAAAPLPSAESLRPKIQALVAELGIAITPLASEDPWLQVNAAVAGPRFTDAALGRLAAELGPHICWLDLSGTAITDAGLAALAAMPRLERLQLDRTGITDAGLAALRGLAELESLNLYGTAITETGLTVLAELPRLRRLYLWQTRVRPEAVQALQQAWTQRPELQAWQRELEQLQARLEQARLIVELGTEPDPPLPAPGVPINTICPVSDKLADSTRTVWHEGQLVAFCCTNCIAAFQKDPARYTPRLAQLANPPPGQLGKLPANRNCPVSGQPAKPEVTAVHGGRLIAFCCTDCRAKFLADPARYLARLDPPP
ncbi:MAG: c-type cytochrome domain-containing protein [Limisphaera sp.]